MLIKRSHVNFSNFQVKALWCGLMQLLTLDKMFSEHTYTAYMNLFLCKGKVLSHLVNEDVFLTLYQDPQTRCTWPLDIFLTFKIRHCLLFSARWPLALVCAGKHKLEKKEFQHESHPHTDLPQNTTYLQYK